MPRPLLAFTTLGLAALVSLSACAGGGSSDVVGSTSGDGGGDTTLSLYAYAVPKVGFDTIIPAFQATPEGKGINFQQSYGASGDQSRKVESGAQADIVNFSVEPDITRLVKAGVVNEDWNTGTHHGVPFGSVVTIVVREGNPKGIKDWNDLLKPGIEVVTPNPFSSGSAKWNLLAPFAAQSNGGQDEKAGLDYVTKLVNDHIKVQPKSGREATETFLQGSGDALLSYENEALFVERAGEKVEHVTPPTTFKIENPVAVLNTSTHAAQAKAFNDYLYTPAAQRLWAESGFRPVDPAVATEFASTFPTPKKEWTIADLGGWGKVNDTYFDDAKGSIAKIYQGATN